MSCLTLYFLFPSPLALSLAPPLVFLFFFFAPLAKCFSTPIFKSRCKHVKIQNSLHFFFSSLSFQPIHQFLMHSNFFFSFPRWYPRDTWTRKFIVDYKQGGKLGKKNEKSKWRKKVHWIRDNVISLVFPSFFMGKILFNFDEVKNYLRKQERKKETNACT